MEMKKVTDFFIQTAKNEHTFQEEPGAVNIDTNEVIIYLWRNGDWIDYRTDDTRICRYNHKDPGIIKLDCDGPPSEDGWTYFINVHLYTSATFRIWISKYEARVLQKAINVPNTQYYEISP